MSTDLKDRLDAMAADATHGVEIHDPSSPIVLDFRRPPRLALAAAAGVAIVALLAAGFWVSRDETTTLDVAGRANSRPMPALFYEDPVPMEQLPEELRVGFETSRIPPLEKLSPNAAAVTFDGVHLVSSDGVHVAVGLDTTGEVLCVATSIDGIDGSTASCGTPAQFASEHSSIMKQSFEHTVTTVLVGDDVVAVELAGTEYPVERNVAIIEGPNNDVLRLHFADGTVEAANSFPVSPAPVGELVDPVAGSIELGLIGCATTNGGVLAEIAFIGPDGLVSGFVAPSGLFVNGTFADTEINVIAPDAVIETSVVDGSLVINATWETDQGQGRLSGNCGDNHIDLSDLR